MSEHKTLPGRAPALDPELLQLPAQRHLALPQLRLPPLVLLNLLGNLHLWL